MQRAIETTGTADEQGQLRLNEPLAVSEASAVRVIVLLPSDEDPDEGSWLRAASRNPAFAFLDDPQEEIYSTADGIPFENAIPP
ncbi:MAG: hypothetical protein ACREKN_04590 [Longimicrobiaceae bacterium]